MERLFTIRIGAGNYRSRRQRAIGTRAEEVVRRVSVKAYDGSIDDVVMDVLSGKVNITCSFVDQTSAEEAEQRLQRLGYRGGNAA